VGAGEAWQLKLARPPKGASYGRSPFWALSVQS